MEGQEPDKTQSPPAEPERARRPGGAGLAVAISGAILHPNSHQPKTRAWS